MLARYFLSQAAAARMINASVSSVAAAPQRDVLRFIEMRMQNLALRGVLEHIFEMLHA